jgi:uncharacterized protein
MLSAFGEPPPNRQQGAMEQQGHGQRPWKGKGVFVHQPHPDIMKPSRPFITVLVSSFLILAALIPAPVSAAPTPDPIRFRILMEEGEISQAREWLDAGLDPNFQGDRIGSGLMVAAWEGNIPLMELFLNRGADVNLQNRLGETALMHAAWKGRDKAVQWLIDHGANVNQGEMQWSPLHYAVFAGHRDLAKTLVKQGADINARSTNGSSVLMMAVYEGHDDMAQWLIEQGADRTVRNEWGDGAVEWAMKFDRLKIARLIVDADTFAQVASRPKESWGTTTRSEPASDELKRLLRLREILEDRKLDTLKIDRRISKERAAMYRASLDPKALPPASQPQEATLEITAKRDAPEEQSARMVVEPK